MVRTNVSYAIYNVELKKLLKQASKKYLSDVHVFFTARICYMLFFLFFLLSFGSIVIKISILPSDLFDLKRDKNYWYSTTNVHWNIGINET